MIALAARRTPSLRVVPVEVHHATEQQLGGDPLWMPREGLPAGGRAECRHGERPCPYVKCKHHLWLVDVRDRSGRDLNGGKRGTALRPRWLEYPTPACCELDVIEAAALSTGNGTLPLADVAQAIGHSERYTEKISSRALRKLIVGLHEWRKP